MSYVQMLLYRDLFKNNVKQTVLPKPKNLPILK